MVISINDHPDIRKVLEGLHFETVNINYTVGGGGGNTAKELILWNENAEVAIDQKGQGNLF